MTVNVDQVVAAYMKLRDQKAVIKKEADEKIDEIETKLDKLEKWIKVKADADGVTSFKTPHGTAFLTTTDFANVEDWDATLNFIKKNDAFDMLERRVSKTAVRAYIELNKSVPAGVNYGTRLDVNVRKPTKKV
jgi:hypothetical protein